MTKIEQSRRKLFEEWYVADALKNSGFAIPIGEVERRRCANGDYADYPGMHGKWLGFNGALDAVAIQLPAGAMTTDGSKWLPVDDFRAAIESTGLGIKTK